MQETNKYAFWIDQHATKIDVKKALKAIYGAEVASVQIVNIAEKFRAVKKGSFNKRKFSRKAYVTLVGKAKLETGKFEKADTETKVTLASEKTAKKATVKKADKAEKTEKKTAKAKKA